MFNDDTILKYIRDIQYLKKKCLAVILSDVEKEFDYEKTIRMRARKLNDDIQLYGKVSTDELILLLDQLDTQLPAYAVVRKIVLDSINDFARNIFSNLLGEVEGYDQRRTSKRYRRDR